MTRRKSELRRELEARKAAIRAQIAAKRPPKTQKKRRWPWLLLLLLLLLIRCEEEPPPPPSPGVAAPGSKSVKTAASVPSAAPVKNRAKPRRARLRGIKVKKRRTFEKAPPKPATWLPAFRLQVAARSPRMARCFEGQPEPGAIEWTTGVDPETGVTADHAFEVIGGGLVLGKEMKRCLTAVLTTPPYGLRGEGAARVTLLIEF